MAKKQQDIIYRKVYEKSPALNYAHIEIIDLDPIDCRESYKRIDVYDSTGRCVWQYALSRGPRSADAWRLNYNHALRLLANLQGKEPPR